MTLSLFVGLISIVFTVFALYKAISPFLSSSLRNWRFEFLDSDLRKVELLSAEKNILVNSLRELEFEYQTEKIRESDYKIFRRRFENQAIQVMKKLDLLHGGRGWDSRIDTLIDETYPDHMTSMRKEEE